MASNDIQNVSSTTYFDGKWKPVPRKQLNYNNLKPVYNSKIPQNYDPITQYNHDYQENESSTLIKPTYIIPYHHSYPSIPTGPYRRQQQPQHYHQHTQGLVPFSSNICDGRKNLVDDLGIIALIISTFSTFVGFGLDLVLSTKVM
jgi:hypothetical protein